MKNAIKILGILFFINIIISCVDNANDKNSNTLTEDQINSSDLEKNEEMVETKKPLFSSYTDHFEHTPEYEMLNITKITLPNLADMNCNNPADEKLCEEIRKLIGNNQLIFNSDEECRKGKYVNQYRILQNGTIKIGDDSHNANLYYNDHSTQDLKKSFDGIIIIKMPTVESLPAGELIIATKK